MRADGWQKVSQEYSRWWLPSNLGANGAITLQLWFLEDYCIKTEILYTEKKKDVQEIHSTLLQPVLVRVQCWHNTYTICLLICLSNLRGNDHYYKCWKSGPSSSPKMNKNALYLTIHKWTFAHDDSITILWKGWDENSTYRLQNNKLKLNLAKLNWIKSY